MHNDVLCFTTNAVEYIYNCRTNVYKVQLHCMFKLTKTILAYKLTDCLGETKNEGKVTANGLDLSVFLHWSETYIHYVYSTMSTQQTNVFPENTSHNDVNIGPQHNP